LSGPGDKSGVGKIILLGVLLAVALYPQSVSVTTTPASLTFTYQIGAAALPSVESVSIKNGSTTNTYTTSVSPLTALWLTVSPDNGKLPAGLSVRVNPTSLSVGVYNAAVVVTIASVSNPVTIPVALTVTAAPSSLALSATTLTFSAPPLPPAAQTVTLSTNGAPISFSATAGATWMTVSPTVGVVLPGDQVSLSVTVDPTSLAPQAAPYSAKITVVASGAAVTTKSQNITVNLTVSSSAPTITSVWPPTLPVNGGPQNITIRGTNFYSATVAKVQGATTPLATTVISSTALFAVVPAAMLTAPATLNVIASNPAPGGDSAVSPITVANIPTIAAIVNAASYAVASVSPGELITIFGTDIGPATPASMSISNGSVDTALSGVSVTVDGQAAPILYVSQNQISVQVPYEATAGANKQVVVMNGANPAANATVTIAATAPGIFTADGSGLGQAAALNYNATSGQYTLNTGSNPAKIGDTVLLYLTGEGNYNASVLGTGTTNTGYIIPSSLNPLPQMNPLPTVTIGGTNAVVAYAGPIVGSMLGLLQMNVVVPTGSTTGATVPLVVTIGGNAAQTGVTLSIHP